ncbi:MAG TPA: acVLRF1 family peptidyl-tRNA hydrolase [Microlunatus sp.]|nr:acVLRF1 family peptidyl-tRNA hydrolase [Microlunatus sp.]
MPAAGRVVEVDLDRLPGWVERFALRHGALTEELVDSADGHQVLAIAAADGARAELAVPFGPLTTAPEPPIERLIDRVGATRTVGILLVRRAGWAAAVVADGTVVSVDTGGGYVQGTTKAGGWSQQRYARRRGNQTQQVWDRAADGTAGVFAPYRSTMDALVTGGDRAGVMEVLADQRLVDLVPLLEPRFFSIGDPNRTVLADVVRRLRCVVITLNELA